MTGRCPAAPPLLGETRTPHEQLHPGDEEVELLLKRLHEGGDGCRKRRGLDLPVKETAKLLGRSSGGADRRTETLQARLEEGMTAGIREGRPRHLLPDQADLLPRAGNEPLQPLARLPPLPPEGGKPLALRSAPWGTLHHPVQGELDRAAQRGESSRRLEREQERSGRERGNFRGGNRPATPFAEVQPFAPGRRSRAWLPSPQQGIGAHPALRKLDEPLLHPWPARQGRCEGDFARFREQLEGILNQVAVELRAPGRGEVEPRSPLFEAKEMAVARQTIDELEGVGPGRDWDEREARGGALSRKRGNHLLRIGAARPESLVQGPGKGGAPVERNPPVAAIAHELQDLDEPPGGRRKHREIQIDAGGLFGGLALSHGMYAISAPPRAQVPPPGGPALPRASGAAMLPARKDTVSIPADLERRFLTLGIAVPRVLLPKPEVDPSRWAVIACDQFTSEPEYWKRVEGVVGEAPSTLSLILPEVYLGRPEEGPKTAAINPAMTSLLERGLLAEQGPLFILVKRSTPHAECRWGLIAALDLERYDFRPGSRSLIRATEGTILDRLPPREAIRREAPFELPHIMVLYDDPRQGVLAPLVAAEGSLERLYDFDLMTDAGHLTGFRVDTPPLLEGIAAAFARLADPDAFRARFGSPDPLLFAVGDGNHSLAAAKELWEKTKRELGLPPEALHPARFALVELVNLHDRGLAFHPIHRLLSGDVAAFLSSLEADPEVRIDPCADERSMRLELSSEGHRVGFLGPAACGVATWHHPRRSLAAATVQECLDRFVEKHPATRVDYIHGEEALGRLARRPGNLGLFLPPIEKGEFFATVIRDGAFPRKTFSMGEALEKRFYFEARRIR